MNNQRNNKNINVNLKSKIELAIALLPPKLLSPKCKMLKCDR
ncbi:hypothetical protein [Floridanema aerugineum]|uniref:Uncharacterized protein n=1 Tax=Floridaenema aerugineum BLCC-F46 TaxID=3153654 RepID=A0ABV4XC12_9CYAN